MFGQFARMGSIGRPSVSAAIRALFSSGELGAWYNPSDIGTLFQDSAGTTPVTAVEQPVGLMLDKSGRGNHASQATTTKRPRLSARYNVVTESEFRNGETDAPTRGGLVTATTMTGYLGALALGFDGVTDTYAYKSIDAPTVLNTLSVVVEMEDGLAPSFGHADKYSALNTFALVVGGSAISPLTYVVSPLGAGRFRVTCTGVGSAQQNQGIVKYRTNDARTFKFTAFDFRLSIDAHLPYQRVNTASDYDADPAKFPAYLRFDGVDDALQTGNIDFTGTDKMTVWAGVTALDMGRTSGATNQLLYSNGDNFNGFGLRTPHGSGGITSLSSGSTGAAETTESGLGAAPRSMVICGVGDQSAPLSQIRRDGVLRGSSTAVQGASGGYGNRSMWIGSQAGASRFFNGRLYSLIVRGAQSSLSQIEATEAYIKQKMRLP